MLRMTQFKFTVGSPAQSQVGNLTWNQNGTLGSLAITDPFNSANTQTCAYAHDDLARLASANCGAAASQTFSYDAFGNISKSGSPYAFQPTYNAATNRFATIPGITPAYDANGNVTYDGSHNYSWDADGNSVTLDGVGLTFDALDRMVEQNRSGSYTQSVYAPTGGKLALMSGQTLQKAFVPLPGQATAVYTSTGLDHYRHSDWLGSARLTSSPSQTYISSVAYAPFGETYAQSGTPDPSFTGMNPDTVSTDYDFLYREYSTQGRWPSPDPAGLAAVDPANPQSWNRYAYVLNNPLGLVDPLGLCGGGDGDNGSPCEPFSYGDGSCTVYVTYHQETITDPDGVPRTYDIPDRTVVCDGGCPQGWRLEPRPFGQAQCTPGHQLGDWVKEPKDRDRGNSSGFTLGIRAPGQSYRQCLGANSSNYSIGGVVGTDNFLLSNDATQLLFGNSAEGSAGLLVWEGGSHSFEAGVGTVMTAGRRTASITSMNLAGTTGPAPRILAKTGAGKLAGWLSGAAELKMAADIGLAGAEAIGCLVPR